MRSDSIGISAYFMVACIAGILKKICLDHYLIHVTLSTSEIEVHDLDEWQPSSVGIHLVGVLFDDHRRERILLLAEVLSQNRREELQ